MTTPPPSDATRIFALVAVLAIICATAVGMLFAIPESQNPATIIVIMLGFGGTIVTAVNNALGTERANKKLDRVLNGEMDGKIQRNLHSVLDERTPIPAQVVRDDSVPPAHVVSEHQGDDELDADEGPHDTDERPDLRGFDPGPRS